jgi:hypothetical protein
MLQKIAEHIWTVAIPHKMMGLHLGTRMTAVKLSNNKVLLHSPIPISEALHREINAIGQVSHIICPNIFHHSYAQEATKAFPNATLHGPKALHKKRADLKFGAELSNTAHPDWANDLAQLSIEGCELQETVFYHSKTKTIISADLSENFKTSDHLPTRLYLKAAGIHGKPGWSKLLRFVYRDRNLAKKSIAQLFNWDFDKVIVAHGDIINQQAKEAIQQTFVWL